MVREGSLTAGVRKKVNNGVLFFGDSGFLGENVIKPIGASIRNNMLKKA